MRGLGEEYENLAQTLIIIAEFPGLQKVKSHLCNFETKFQNNTAFLTFDFGKPSTNVASRNSINYVSNSDVPIVSHVIANTTGMPVNSCISINTGMPISSAGFSYSFDVNHVFFFWF